MTPLGHRFVCDQFRVNFSGENSQLLELCTAYLTPYFQTASQGTFEAQAFCTSPDNVIIPPSISNGNGQLIQFHKGRTAVRYNVSPNKLAIAIRNRRRNNYVIRTGAKRLRLES